MSEKTTVAERLGSLIGEHEGKIMSIRAFAEAMKSRDPRPPGSTRAMIHRYLKAEGPEPPAEFIAAAAEVLRVDPAWLAWGTGHQDKLHEAAAAVAAEAQPDVADWTTRLLGKDIHREVMEGMGLEIENDATVPYWVAPLGQLWSQFQQFAPPREAASPPYPPETQIAQALVWPVKAFGIEPERLQDSGLLERYILAATPALLILGDAYRWQLRRADQDARDSNDLRDEENEDA